MPRVDIEISAENRARGAFQQAQQDIRRTGQAIQIVQDAAGRFRDAATGRYVAAQRAMAQGFTELGQAATRSTVPIRQSGAEAERLTRVGQQLADAFIRMPGPIGRAGQSMHHTGRSVEQLTDRFIALYRNSAAVRQIGRDFRFYQRDIQATASITAQFSRAVNDQTRAVIQEAAQIERLRLGLRTLSPSIQEAEDQYQRLIQVARLPGIDFGNALQANNQLIAIGKSGEEATRILMAFGNALALSGASNADIQRTIYGLRQLIADGRVYQRELNLITSRVPTAIPILENLFGGVRAENIRTYFDALGVEGSQQATEFIRLLLPELEKLPRASETAYNALENLGDTSRRLQGAIGENLLPAVKEGVTALEGLLLSAEDDDRFKTATADALAFATAMGTTTAGILGVTALIPLLGGLASPIGIAALAAGALAGAFVRAEVQAARFREEFNRTQEALRNALRVGRTEDVAGIQRRIEALEARRTAIQNQINAIERTEREALRPTLGGSRLFEDNVQQALEANDAYQTYQDQLFQVNKTIEVLTRRTDELTESQQDNADTVANTLATAYRDLTAAASGTDAEIAEALQRFENITASEEDSQVVDLARDIGSELVGIAESTSASQIAANKKRVDALARDNSLIIADNERLQALLTSTGKATAARLGSLLDRPRSADELREIITLSQELARTVPAAREVYTRAVETFNRQQRGELRGQQARDTIARRQELQGIIASIGEAETVQEIRQIQAQVQAFKDGLNEKRVALETFAQEFAAINAAINRQAAIINETLRGEAQGRQGRAEAQRRLAIRQQVGAAITAIREAENREAVDTSVQQIQLTEATEAQILRVKEAAAQRTEVLDDEALSRLASNTEARIAQFEDEVRARRQVEDAKQQKAAETHDYEAYLLKLRRDGVSRAERELARLQERALDAGSSRRIEIVQREVQQAIERYSRLSEAYTGVIQDLTMLSEDLDISLDHALRAERLERFRDGLRDVVSDIVGLGLDRLFDGIFGGDNAPSPGVFRLVEDLNNAANNLSRIRFSDVSSDLSHLLGGIEFDPTGYARLEDAFAGITVSGDNLATAISEITDSIRFERLEQDRLRRRGRLQEDTAERIRNLQTRLRAVAARGGGDARQIARNIQQQQDLRFAIAEARRAGQTQLERYDEDSAIRQSRFIEDALNQLFQRQQQRVSFPEQALSILGNSISNSISNAIGGAISNFALDLLSNPINNLVESIRNLFDRDGDGDGDGQGQDGATQQAEGEADVAGMITALTLDPAVVKPDVTGLKGIISVLELDPAAIKPDVTALKGIISELTLSDTVVKPESIDLSAVPVTLPEVALDVKIPETIDLSQVPVTPPTVTPKIDLPATLDFSGIDAIQPTIKPKIDLPDTIDLSGVPVRLPDATLEVGVPQQFNLSAVPVTLPAATTFPIALPDAFDLSDVPVTVPQEPIQIPVENIMPDIVLPTPDQLPPFDIPINPITPEITLPELTLPELILPEITLPDGLIKGLDGLKGALDGISNRLDRLSTGIGSLDLGSFDLEGYSQSETDPLAGRRYYERYPQFVAARQAAALGVVGRPLTDAERARLNQGSANPLDVFGDLIDTGLTALPDFAEPFARQVLSIGVGVSQEGGETFLTTAHGTKIARIETESDTGATTIIRTPDTSAGAETPELDTETSSETVTTTVSLPGQGRGRAGLNPLIDPAEYSKRLDEAIQGGLDREALFDAVTSAVTPVTTPEVFDVTFSGNQITITPQIPDFDPSRTTDPVFPTFQRPTLTRRPPEPSFVEVDYGQLFEGALGNFTGGESRLQRLLYFTTGLDIPQLSGPPPQPDDDDDDETPKAPSAFPQVAPDAPTIDLESLKLNEIGILTNALLGELVNVSAQQFEVQASIAEFGAAQVQNTQLLATAQLPVVNSLAAIKESIASMPESLDSIRIGIQQIADRPLVDQLLEAGVVAPQTLADRTAFNEAGFTDLLSQGGINLFSALGGLDQRIADLGLIQPEDVAESMMPTPDLTQLPGSSAQNLAYVNVQNFPKSPEIQKVQVVGGELDAKVTGTVQSEVTNVVPVQIGQVVRVYVEGGAIDIDADALSRLIYESVVQTDFTGETSFGEL